MRVRRPTNAALEASSRHSRWCFYSASKYGRLGFQKWCNTAQKNKVHGLPSRVHREFNVARGGLNEVNRDFDVRRIGECKVEFACSGPRPRTSRLASRFRIGKPAQ